MRNMSMRLEKIASFVDKDSKVADIGTDHGFVPNFLVDKNISDFVICTDISKNSLDKSIELINLHKNQDKIFPRVGDGLKVIKDGEVDTIIIAGLGSYLIKNILENNFEIVKNAKKLILQPMQSQEVLRKYLYTKYEIIDEAIVYEDTKYFEIIVAKFDGIKKNVDDIFYEIPKILFKRKDKSLISYLEYKIESNKRIISFIKNNSKSEDSLEKIKILENKNKRLRELIWK